MNSGIRIEDNAIYKGALSAGKVEGSAERAKNVAMNFLKLGKLSDQDIVDNVGITIQELNDLKRQLNTNGHK